ncbi:MAG: class I SAM-dependent methyltransferase [Gemmatimonadaceae bacterium]|nr:class I SAM-dependent methyltransferase [Gemmatimonadaceae bacterium]
MMDPNHVREFWELRAERIHDLPFESVGNLEQDAANLVVKRDHETQRVFDVLTRAGIGADDRVVDLGAGVGQWAFRLAPHVREVVAVERSTGFVNIFRDAMASRGTPNVRIVHDGAETWRPAPDDAPFDAVFISGLFVYLVDAQADTLMRALPTYVAPGGTVIVRDGTSILGTRHAIDRRWSAHLETEYSAIYRTRDEYVAMFTAAGFRLEEDAPMFPEGHVLNKYPETRLWLYCFRREA